MFRKWFFSLLVTSVIASGAIARELTELEKVSDFQQTVSMMKSGYGPLQYKKETMKLDLDKIAQEYLQRVKETKSNKEFYYLMVEFIAEFNDTHFSASVPTTHSASVPFQTDLVDGRVLIDTIDRNQLSEKDFPFFKGDEVLEVDGENIEFLVNRLSRRRGHGFELSEKRYGAMAVTSRPGTIFEVPTGNVVFKIRHHSTNEVSAVTLKWNEIGTPLDESIQLMETVGSLSRTNYDNLSIDPSMTLLEKKFRCSGNTRIEIPKDAVIIMKTPEAPFVAYYHPTPKGNIGYLRIPHYSPVNELTGVSEYYERFAQYEYAVNELEKHTVGLVIDQDHNCGGSVAYLHRMLGLFMPGQYKPMQFTLLANKQEYLTFAQWMEEEVPFSLGKTATEKVLSLIKKSWDAGEYMTPMTSIDGVDSFYANPVHYTKPIVILIDEMSGSGGDAFPAMMQGYGRAKLIGTRTMGAGGHVVVQPPLYYSQIGFRMTKSLFYRPDGMPIENNGAVPDYPYTITRDDFVGGYQNYQQFYLNKLFDLVE